MYNGKALVSDLMELTEPTSRGLEGSSQAASAVSSIVDNLATLNRDIVTTSSHGARALSGTWRLVWTTEKETLFILRNAGLFGTTQAGEVFQVSKGCNELNLGRCTRSAWGRAMVKYKVQRVVLCLCGSAIIYWLIIPPTSLINYHTFITPHSGH